MVTAKKKCPVGDRTRELPVVSRLPWPLDQGATQELILSNIFICSNEYIFCFSWLGMRSPFYITIRNFSVRNSIRYRPSFRIIYSYFTVFTSYKLLLNLLPQAMYLSSCENLALKILVSPPPRNLNISNNTFNPFLIN